MTPPYLNKYKYVDKWVHIHIIFYSQQITRYMRFVVRRVLWVFGGPQILLNFPIFFANLLQIWWDFKSFFVGSVTKKLHFCRIWQMLDILLFLTDFYFYHKGIEKRNKNNHFNLFGYWSILVSFFLHRFTLRVKIWHSVRKANE